MKFTAIVAAAAAGCVQAQLVCDVLPPMVSLDTQDNECCGAAIILVSAGAIATGMGSMVNSCLHMDTYAEYFPDGCTDCTQPGDAENIVSCKAGSSPSLTSSAAALGILCCKEVTGGLCHQSIVAGGDTGSGAMNGNVVGGFDADSDGQVDMCADVSCGPPPPTDAPTASPPTNLPTPSPTVSPTASQRAVVMIGIIAESSDGLCEAAEEVWSFLGATCEIEAAGSERRILQDTAFDFEMTLTAQVPEGDIDLESAIYEPMQDLLESDAFVAAGANAELVATAAIPTAEYTEDVDLEQYEVAISDVKYTRAATPTPTLSPTATPTIATSSPTASPTITSGASTTALSLVAGAVCAVAGLVM